MQNPCVEISDRSGCFGAVAGCGRLGVVVNGAESTSYGGFAVSAGSSSHAGPSVFYASDSCRLIDSRDVGTGSGWLGAGKTRSITAVGTCSIPADATALSVNVTAVLPTKPTHITLFPNGSSRPDASTLNPTPQVGVVANTTDVRLGNGKFS
ncbi:unnamed protein product, partial [Symbiodinium sp. KB8]